MSRYSFYRIGLLEFIEDEFPGCFSKSKYARIIVETLINNFPRRINVNEMSCTLGISDRWLKKVCAVSFHITYTRLKRVMLVYTALKLLSDSKNKYEVSDILLYSEVTNFMRDFRMELHICPNDASQQFAFMEPKEMFDSSWIGPYIKRG